MSWNGININLKLFSEKNAKKEAHTITSISDCFFFALSYIVKHAVY